MTVNLRSFSFCQGLIHGEMFEKLLFEFGDFYIITPPSLKTCRFWLNLLVIMYTLTCNTEVVLEQQHTLFINCKKTPHSSVPTTCSPDVATVSGTISLADDTLVMTLS